MASEHSLVTISVVIPAYNAGSLLGETLDSVLAQSHPAHEILVVDDGSTDDTAEVVSKYGDAVRYLRQESQGQAIARNTGIQAATLRRWPLWGKVVPARRYKVFAHMLYSQAAPAASSPAAISCAAHPADADAGDARSVRRRLRC